MHPGRAPPPLDEYPRKTASRNPFSKGPTKRSKVSDKKVRWQESAHPPGGGIGKKWNVRLSAPLPFFCGKEEDPGNEISGA